MYAKFIRIILLTFIISLVSATGVLRFALHDPLPLPNTVSKGWLYDTQGFPLGSLSSASLISYPLSYEEFPAILRDIFVASEDRFFYQHIGVSLRGILRAAYVNMQSNSTVQGASTIPMQLARNVIDINAKRTRDRKLQETRYALKRDTQHKKDQILTAYLNTIRTSNTTQGIQAGALYHFNRGVNRLTDAEIIALVTMIKNPDLYSPYNTDPNSPFHKRFAILTDLLLERNIISLAQHTQIMHEDIVYHGGFMSRLPYTTDFLSNPHPIGADIPADQDTRTTFDIELTERIDTIGFETIKELATQGVGDYAILVAERKSGAIRVMIGGKAYTAIKNGKVNATLAPRQPGSTIKPFTYLLAFRDLGYTPQDLITDLPVQYTTAEGFTYRPGNFDLQYRGDITLGEALASSVNIPAIKLADEIGTQRLLDFLHIDLDMTSLTQDHSYYGVALTLGNGEVTLYELLRAYSIFARAGALCTFIVYEEQTQKCEQIIDPLYIQMIVDTLSNRYLKLDGFPINSPTDIPYRDVFLKTGTSRNFVDNRAIGFTKDYMIGVRVGNKDGTPMREVSGALGAGRIFRDIVLFLQTEYTQPTLYTYKQKNETTRAESYLNITSPLDGSVYYLDTKDVSNTQAIIPRIATNIDYDTLTRYIDGEPFTDTIRPLEPGFHTFQAEITDSNKREIATHTIQVNTTK